MNYILFFSGSYLIGSIPFSWLIAKYCKGLDLRRHGSGNPGATNVTRTCGVGLGRTAFALDLAKGMAPVLLARHFLTHNAAPLIAIGVCAIAGHMWTIFLNFKGGKGVATSAGVFFGLLPLPTTLALALFAVIFLIWRMISLASILAALSLPVIALLTRQSAAFTVFGALIAIFIVIKHIPNIKRIIAGTEQKWITEQGNSK
jgi:glycerol-3-phosphate acyltransferase PlsY